MEGAGFYGAQDLSALLLLEMVYFPPVVWSTFTKGFESFCHHSSLFEMSLYGAVAV